jgi:hypothetical protein
MTWIRSPPRRPAASVRERTYASRQGAHPRPMNDLSAEAVLHREILKLGEWLTAQGLDLQNDHPHADEGSRDRLYLRYGYFIGLKQALALLTGRGATIH